MNVNVGFGFMSPGGLVLSGPRCHETVVRAELAGFLWSRRHDVMKEVAARTLKVLILDEADLMFSYGYEDDAGSRDSVIIPFNLRERQFAKVKALCALMPPKYQVQSLVGPHQKQGLCWQAMLVSATLSEEVEQLKARTRRRSERRHSILVSGGPDAPQAGRPQAGGAARDGKAYTAGASKGCTLEVSTLRACSGFTLSATRPTSTLSSIRC